MGSDSSGSSPDPLGLSIDERQQRASSMKRGTTPSSPRKPFGEKKGNIRLQDFYLKTPPSQLVRSTSPTKSIAQSENLISPWRIRVTVEAEMDEDENNQMAPSPSPFKRLTGRTLTTTVPLKDADASPAPQKRGRPRKSLENPKKRKGTPKPTRRKTQAESLANIQSSDPVGVTPTKKPRGRPRKTLGGDTQGHSPQRQSSKRRNAGYDSETITVFTPEKILEQNVKNLESENNGLNTASSKASTSVKDSNVGSTPMPKKRKRRNAMTPVRFTGNEDIQETETGEGGTNKEPLDQQQLEAIEASRVQTRLSPPPSSPRQSLEDIEDSSRDHRIPKPGVSDRDETFRESHQTPSPSYGPSEVDLIASPDLGDEVNSDNNEDEDIAPIDDPTRHHQEFDSILESEEFSMVSVSTLPSTKQLFGISPEMEAKMADIARSLDRQPTESKAQGMAEISYPQLPNESSKDFQPNLSPQDPRFPASVAQTTSPRIHTPLNQREDTETSAQKSIASMAPPAIKPTSLEWPNFSPEDPHEGTSRLARVTRAGAALHEVLGSETRSGPTAQVGFPSRANSNSSSASRPLGERRDDLFSGFGAGTRRELKAGLRLGEELAKRSKIAMQAAAVQLKSSPVRNSINSQHTTPELPKLHIPTPQNASPANHSSIDSQMINTFGQTPLNPASERQSSNNSQSRRISTVATHLPSPDDSKEDEDRMSWTADIPSNMGTLAQEESQSLKRISSSINAQDEWRANRERQWQIEREAISRQIQNANSSKVIVIEDTTIDHNSATHSHFEDSDTEADGDDLDIWQSEACSGENSQKTQQATEEARRLLFPDAVAKPRRGKLPSPWRRNSKIMYSDEVNPTSDDPFWPTKQIISNPPKSPNKRGVHDDFSDTESMSESVDFQPEDESQTPFQSRPILAKTTVLTEQEDEFEEDLAESEVSNKSQETEVPDYSEDKEDIEDPEDAEDTEYAEFEDGEDKEIQEDDKKPQRIERLTSARDTKYDINREKTVPRVMHEAPAGPSAKKPSCSDVARSLESSHPPDNSPNVQGDVQYPELPSYPDNSKTSKKRSLPELQSSDESPHASKRPRLVTVSKTTIPSSNATSQTSWLGRLGFFIPRPTLRDILLWTVPPYLQPRGPKPHATEPLSICIPWTNAHYRALRRIYLVAKSDPYAYPYASWSESAYLLEYDVRSQGWKKPVEKWELGVVDAFLDLLKREGWVDFVGREEDEDEKEIWEIDEKDVIKRVFSLWCGEVMRGETELGLGTAGEFEERYKHREAAVKGW